MAGLGYKDFTAGAVLTAAQVDGYLMEQSVMNFAGTAARGSALSSVQAAGMMAHVGGGTVTVYDGSAWQQVYPVATSPGLVYVAGTAFSAAASVSVNNCFTSTYDQYLITLDYTQTTTDRVDARLRVGGVDNTTASSYTSQVFYASGVGTGAARTVSDKWSAWSESTSTSRMQANINVYSPAIARITGFTSFHQFGGSNGAIQFSAGTHSQTVAYDGFTLIPATGTMTGTLRVYGYRNS